MRQTNFLRQQQPDQILKYYAKTRDLFQKGKENEGSCEYVHCVDKIVKTNLIWRESVTVERIQISKKLFSLLLLVKIEIPISRIVKYGIIISVRKRIFRIKRVFKLNTQTTHANRRKQSGVKACRKREKGKVDTLRAKMVIMAEFFEKENQDPNVRQEHVEDTTWADPAYLKKSWKQKIPGLNSYFDEVDNFEMEVEKDVDQQEDSAIFKKPGITKFDGI